jgi:hypothetical protein
LFEDLIARAGGSEETSGAPPHVVALLAMADAAAATSRCLLFLAVCLQAAAAKGTPYIVGGADGWRVPPPEVKERYYADWAASITFYVDDSIGNRLRRINTISLVSLAFRSLIPPYRFSPLF